VRARSALSDSTRVSRTSSLRALTLGAAPFGFESKEGRVISIRESEEGRVIGIRESEAQALRKASTDILNGVTTYAISKAWNLAGLRTPREAVWMPHTVRGALLRPRNAGWLTCKGERINGNQPEIVDPETFEAVAALLNAPGRKPKA
jgi:hypothetical protein